MHLECHAILGWTIGNVGGAGRKLRAWCTIGAILPDIDAIPYIFGPRAYENLHHTFGHNVFLWMLFTGWVAARFRTVRAGVLAFISFGSHLLTDASFSGWPLYLWWPFSKQGYVFANAVELHHPANLALLYVSFAMVVLLAIMYQRTPLEFISPRLDALVISFFQKRTVSCTVCGKPANQICDSCRQPVCIRHAAVGRQWTLRCAKCAAAERPAAHRPP